MTESEKRKHLIEAWSKIAAYVKETYAGVFPKEQAVSWKHHVFYRIEFMVKPDGTAYFCSGPHGRLYYRDDEQYMLPNGNNVIDYDGLEEVILNWQDIKRILEQRAEDHRRIVNFTV